MNECPSHNGSFDCTPFCQTCEGEQAYDPSEMMKCIVGDCQDRIAKDIWVEELGFCVEHSHAYYNQELDHVTLERIEN
jgi:hypothetical protein